MSRTYYLSKYAMSKGVQKLSGSPLDTNSISILLDGYPGWCYFRLGRDVHTTESAAIVAAEDMRLKKIASLKKQIAKLEKLSFAQPGREGEVGRGCEA